MHTLRQAVVVIAGASSGIGRAAALAFARRGARVVLGARRRSVLEDVARQCRAAGGTALVVQTDVVEAPQVEALASAALQTFGRIDVWINNVGTGVFGPYEQALADLHRRVVETNLIGAMNGVSAVLPTFLRQREGVLINMASLSGWAPTPFAASYTATKFALRGLSSSLRAELAEHPDIHVCGVFPSLVDTPGLAHGANMSGRALQPSGHFLSAETVAERMVDLALHPRDEVAVGWLSSVVWLAFTLAPGLTERAMGAVFRRYLRNAPEAPRSEGAVMAPVAEGTGISGGWRAREPMLLASSIPGWALAGAALLVGAAIARARR